MKVTAFTALTLVLASAAVAGLTPGYVVQEGAPFPIVADFNGDGLDDLVQDREVILNDGTALATVVDLGLPDGIKVVGVLDANGDGRLDLLANGSDTLYPPQLPQPPLEGPTYGLYLASPSRTYSESIFISKGPRPVVADVDGDGKDDLVVMVPVRPDKMREIATEVNVLRSLGNGQFEALPPFRIAANLQIFPDHRIQSGDLNRDGRPDLMIRGVEELVILLGTGGGRFTVDSRFLPMGDEFHFRSNHLADIDGDSNLDIVMPGFRSIRVLFGDGRGRFPRTTRTVIAKLHEIELWPGIPDWGVDRANQPRNLAVGHFTRQDRLQIAAGTGEGDLVVFEYERSGLREVARLFTEFWLLDIRSGKFRGSGATDLYVIGTMIWGEMYPKPRLFYGSTGAASASDEVPGRAGRSRAVNRTIQDTALRMQMQCDCVEVLPERWKFTRDGVFGRAQTADSTIEAVFDGDLIYLRFNAPYSKEPIRSVLVRENGAYSGTANVLTSCGWKPMTLTARVD